MSDGRKKLSGQLRTGNDPQGPTGKLAGAYVDSGKRSYAPDPKPAPKKKGKRK